MTETNDVEDGSLPWIEQLAIFVGGRLYTHHGLTVTTTPVMVTSSGPEIRISAMLPSEFHWTARILNPPVDLGEAAKGIAAAFIVAQRSLA